MLIASLHAMLKFVMTLGTIFGLAFMVICTALVIVSLVCGDIKINIIKNETENEKK